MAQLYQYQKIAQPPFDTSQPPPEVVTRDKWAPRDNTPDAHWHKAAHYSLAALVATSIFVPVPSQISNPGGTQDRVSEAQTVVITYERVTQYQSRFEPVLISAAAPEDITLDKWWQPTQQPRFDKTHTQYLFTRPIIERVPSAPPENMTSDKWQPTTQQPLFDLSRSQYTYPTLFVDLKPIAAPSETITVDKWYSTTTNPRIRDRRVIPLNMAFRAGAESDAIDKWWQTISRPTFDIERLQHTYPSLFFDVEPIEEVAPTVALDWQGNTLQIPRIDRDLALLVISTNFGSGEVVIPSPVDLDRWYHATETPPKGQPILIYSFPTLFWNPETPVTVPPSTRVKLEPMGILRRW